MIEKVIYIRYNIDVTISGISTYQQYERLTSTLGSEHTESIQKVEDHRVEDTFSTPRNDEIEDTAIISDRAKAMYEAEQFASNSQKAEATEKLIANSIEKDEKKQTAYEEKVQEDRKTEKSELTKEKDLTPEQKQEVAKMQKTDADVKAHEQAHKAAAGGLNTSAANYQYEEGPDGNKYAVAGDVSISYREGSDPEENLRNAQALKRAALAPADPSSTDKAVASSADAKIAEAQRQIQEQQQEEQKGSDDDSNIKSHEPKPLLENENEERTAPQTVSQRQQEAHVQAPINAAESVINPSAKAIYQ